MAVLLAGMLVFAGSPAWAGAGAHTAPTGPAATENLTEEQRALAEAAATGRRVEVVGARTEFSTTYANPGGTSFRLEQSVVPVRVRAADGTWVAPDPTLEVRADGSVGPKAAAVAISFSGGGAGETLARIAREGRSLDMGWPGRLPKPVLDGDTAVYAEVLPGVDLRMTATAEGLRDVLVVKTPVAAANPALKKLDFSLDPKGLKISPSERGGFLATDANARKVFVAAPAMMWDSSGPDGSTPGAAAEQRRTVAPETSPSKGPLPGARHARLPIRLDRDGFSIAPDPKLLGQTDPDAFPIYIDPPVTWGESERTLLRNDGYEKYGWDNGTDGRGMGVGKCGTWNGYYCGPGYVQRLYYEFSPTKLAGKHILDATFRVTEPWAFQCDPRWVDLVRTNNISSATTWSSRPAELDWMVDRHVSAGRGSLCDPDQPDAPIDFSDNPEEPNENLTPTVRAFAEGKFDRLTLQIRAHDESDTSAWKRFKDDAVLVVDYVGKPYVPSARGLVAGSGTVCSTDAARPSIISDLTPQLSATVRTYAGGEEDALLKALFWLEKQSGTTWATAQGDILSPGGTGHLASGGTTKPVLSTSLVEGQLYRMSARTRSYWNNYASYLTSGATGHCYFKVDPTAPRAPTVTAVSTYQLCTTTSCYPKGGPGTAGSFKFSPATGDTVVAYRYRRSGMTTWTTVSGASPTVPIVPPETGTYLLEVQAQDGIARWGASQIVGFLVSPGRPEVGRWRFDEATGATALDTASTVSAEQDNLTLAAGAARDEQGRRGEVWHDAHGRALTTPRQDRGVTHNGTSWASTAGPVLETRSAFTVAAWVRLGSKEKTAVVLSQDGSRYSNFVISYETAYDSWYFGVKEKDAETGEAYWGTSGKIRAQVGVWTHVAGTYDPVTRQLALYIDGILQGTSLRTSGWASTGPLQIARYKWAGAYAGHFKGGVDEVAVWQRALTAEEVVTEARTLNAQNGRPEVELVAAWEPVGATGTAPVADRASGYGRALTLGGGAASDGEALVFDGVDDAATTPGPLVDDFGSFTVTANAELSREKVLAMPVKSSAQVMGQRTADGSSWGLWYELRAVETLPDENGVEYQAPLGFWHFGRIDKDGTATWVESDTVADLDTPVRLTGVFDAHGETGPEIQMYVGGDPQDTAKPYTARSGSGEFSLAKGLSSGAWGHHLPARISDVRVWAGAMNGAPQVRDVIIAG
ncbi:LamG domain-containing protein [Streptomyces sp. NPDC004779]